KKDSQEHSTRFSIISWNHLLVTPGNKKLGGRISTRDPLAGKLVLYNYQIHYSYLKSHRPVEVLQRLLFQYLQQLYILWALSAIFAVQVECADLYNSKRLPLLRHAPVLK